MGDDLAVFIATRAPTAERPLLGLTVLAVEDSRFACEAMRLMCLHSGARLRRADSLRAARRHLRAYRPTAVIVDHGLPDGSGLELIRGLSGRFPRVPVLLATSGDATAEGAALAAGADGFLLKPIESLSAFQNAVLAALPPGARPVEPPAPAPDRIAPDPLALRDDLAHAAEMLGSGAEGAALDYLAQFLSGLARASHDAPLRAAAEALGRDRLAGRKTRAPVSRINALVRDRLAAGTAF